MTKQSFYILFFLLLVIASGAKQSYAQTLKETDLYLVRGDSRTFVLTTYGDVTADELLFVVKKDTAVASVRLIQKQNTVAGGSDSEIEATYRAPFTKIQIKFIPVDTEDLLRNKYKFDLTRTDPDDSTDHTHLFIGNLNMQPSIATPGDGSNVPLDGTRFYFAGLDSTTKEPGVLIGRNSDNSTDWWSLETLGDSLGVITGSEADLDSLYTYWVNDFDDQTISGVKTFDGDSLILPTRIRMGYGVNDFKLSYSANEIYGMYVDKAAYDDVRMFLGYNYNNSGKRISSEPLLGFGFESRWEYPADTVSEFNGAYYSPTGNGADGRWLSGYFRHNEPANDLSFALENILFLDQTGEFNDADHYVMNLNSSGINIYKDIIDAQDDTADVYSLYGNRNFVKFRNSTSEYRLGTTKESGSPSFDLWKGTSDVATATEPGVLRLRIKQDSMSVYTTAAFRFGRSYNDGLGEVYIVPSSGAGAGGTVKATNLVINGTTSVQFNAGGSVEWLMNSTSLYPYTTLGASLGLTNKVINAVYTKSVEFGASVVNITYGTGAPAVGGTNGSIYIRTDGTAGNTVYIREDGIWRGLIAKGLTEFHPVLYMAIDDTIPINVYDYATTWDSIQYKIDDSVTVQIEFGANGTGSDMFATPKVLTGKGTITSFADNTIDALSEVQMYFTNIGDTAVKMWLKIYRRE